jgi:hypothetical protein
MDLFENYHQPTDPLGIQRDEITRFQKQFMRNLVGQKYRMGVDLNDITDLVYVENRLAFWNGILLANVLSSIRIYPLVNFKATRTAYQVDYRQRQIDRVHFEVMRRVCEPLVKAPFLNNTWSVKLRPYIERSGIAVAKAPFKTDIPFSMKATLPWSFEFIQAGWDDIVDLIEGNPKSGIFEIIDRDKFQRLITNHDDITKSITKVKQVFSLIEMQLLLTGDYLPRYEGNLGIEPKLNTNINGISINNKGEALSFSSFINERNDKPAEKTETIPIHPPTPKAPASKQTQEVPEEIPAAKMHYCVCCNGSFARMLPAGGRQNVRCPQCDSLERHRLLTFFLKEKTNLFTDSLRLLHIAPHEALKDTFHKIPNIEYAGMEKLPDDGLFSAIVCIHFLEKIADRARTASRLFRALESGGWAVIMVPAHLDQGMQECLAEAGFVVRVDRFNEAFTSGERNRYVLADDPIYYCEKPEYARTTA